MCLYVYFTNIMMYLYYTWVYMYIIHSYDNNTQYDMYIIYIL